MTLFLLLLSLTMIVYVIAVYPLLLLVLARIKGPRVVSERSTPRRVDFLIPAHNEAAVIREKVANTLALANPDGHRLSVLVISDGSTDATVKEASASGDPRVRVIETKGRAGKLGALNEGLEALAGDVVVFSDANALLSDQALAAIIRHFEDPQVGGVCGQISIAKTGGEIAAADSLFWRYDQLMKQAESDLGGVVSAQGSLYAIRRELCAPVPAGFADDFIMSVGVVDQGYRLAFEPRATAVEAVTEHAGNEFQRRVRSTTMGWRGLMRMRHLMNPFTQGLYGWQLLSHKGLRRLTPAFLLIALLSNLALLGAHPLLTLLGLGQLLFYSIAALAYVFPSMRKLPLAGKIMFFTTSNIAMGVGILDYYRGKEISIWTPVRES